MRKNYNVLPESNFYLTYKIVCIDYLVGKIYKKKILFTPYIYKSNIFYLINTDICYMQDKTLRGVYYFVTFIDDHSRKVWAIALKAKD